MLRRAFRKISRPASDLSAAEKAGRLFDQGQNCAQAVLQATTGTNDSQLLAICDAFGSGIGGAKCLCGAVSGGVIALSLSGRGQQAGKLVERFKARNKTTCCKGLSAPFRWESREHLANCRDITVSTAAIVEDLLR